jgi:hypothetical protein
MFDMKMTRYAGGVGRRIGRIWRFLSMSYWMETFHLLGRCGRGISC